MRLVDLNPRFIGAGGDGVYQNGAPCPHCTPRPDGTRTDCTACDGLSYELVPAPERFGVGIMLTCPCGNPDEDHELYVPFANPLDGGPAMDPRHGWQRTGDTFDTLTLTPSILRVRPYGCGWHGFITAGNVTGQVE